MGSGDLLRVVRAQPRSVRSDPTRLLALVLRVDTRSQGVPQSETDQRDDRQVLISTLVRAILSDPDKDELDSELQESRYNEFTALVRKHRRNFAHKGILKALSCACCQTRHNAPIVSDTRRLETCIANVEQFSRWSTKVQKL